MTEVSALEMDAILLSRMFNDGDRVFVGANLPAPRAGALLAAMTRCPSLRVVQALAWVDVPSEGPVDPPRPGMDLRDADRAEALIRDYEVFDDIRRLSSVFVIGGLEIDRDGNTNLLGIPSEAGWHRRGPGPVGTTTMSAVTPRTILYSTRHTPKVLVERCAAISALGWRTADGRERAELGLGTPGPEACITPGGVFTFPEPAHHMRLTAVRPGWTVDRVVSETGFAVEASDPCPSVDPPTDVEVDTLRSRIDLQGALRG